MGGTEDFGALADWPYADEVALLLGHKGLIEQHGRSHLLRALNGRRAIAVIGSGVSAAYGRLSWHEIMEHMRVWVQEQYREGEQYREEEQEQFRAEQNMATRNLAKASLETLKLDRPISRQTKELQRAFQMLENYFVILCASSERLHEDYPGSAVDNVSAEDRARARFREEFRSCFLCHDRRLEQLLKAVSKPFVNCEKYRHRKTLLNVLDTFRTAPPENRHDDSEKPVWAGDYSRVNEALFRSVYSYPSIQKLSRHVPSNDDREITAAKRAVEVYTEKHGDYETLAPSKWFLVDALLDVINIDLRCGAERVEVTKFDWFDEVYDISEKHQVGSFDRAKETRDPLYILFRRLGMTRFLTTNYDPEIETMFRSLGFREQMPGSDEAPGRAAGNSRIDCTNTVGERCTELAFSPAHGADIIDFALEERADLSYVVHLHGSALGDSNLAITDADYTSFHASPGIGRATSTAAMDLAFTSNPLVFIGLGMSEPDILRPLRTFSEGIDSLSDRPAIAVMPMCSPHPGDIGRAYSESETTEYCARQAASLLNGYGVYSVYYGACEAKSDEDSDPHGMAKLLFDLSKLSSIDAGFPQPVSGEYAFTDEDDRKRVRSGASKLSAELAKEDNPLDGIIERLESLLILEEQSVKENEFSICVLVLKLIRKRLLPLAAAVSGADPFDADKATTFLHAVEAMTKIAQGVASDIQSRFLCAFLQSLQQDHYRWQRKWIETPVLRKLYVPEAKEQTGAVHE